MMGSTMKSDRFIYLIYNYRLLYYLPMERMSKTIEISVYDLQELRNENKNLKKELELVRKNTRTNVETLDNMYWENVDLKKENKELQRENDTLKIRIEAKDKAYMDLLADYNYLKARIKKTERAFIKYKEKLEKLEVDLDMVVMNR